MDWAAVAGSAAGRVADLEAAGSEGAGASAEAWALDLEDVEAVVADRLEAAASLAR